MYKYLIKIAYKNNIYILGKKKMFVTKANITLITKTYSNRNYYQYKLQIGMKKINGNNEKNIYLITISSARLWCNFVVTLSNIIPIIIIILPKKIKIVIYLSKYKKKNKHSQKTILTNFNNNIKTITFPSLLGSSLLPS